MMAPRLILILVAVVMSLGVGATALAAQRDNAPSGPAKAFGVDPASGTCPTSKPDELTPSALAGATRAALSEAPGLYRGMNTKGRYAESAYRGEVAPVKKFWVNACADRPRFGKRLQARSVQVNMIFPEYLPSASLSEHWVFVARFGGEYRVWGVYR